MIRKSVLKMGWLAVALAVLVCSVPVSAQTVTWGLDFWKTQQGAAVAFTGGQAIPAGFFPCGAGFTGNINVTGKPIAASKNTGGADTVLARLNDVAGGNGFSNLLIVALSMHNTNWTGPCGNSYTVKVRLDPNRAQPLGGIVLTNGGNGGGTYDAAFTVYGEVTFTDNFSGNVLGPVQNDITLITRSACWVYSGGRVVGSPITIDTTCDGVPNLTSPKGTSNFFAGWCPNPGGGGPIWTPPPHDGPHPVGAPQPPKPCTPTEIEPHQLPDGGLTSTAGTIVVAPAPEPLPKPCLDASPR